jgi:hypothetical protein
MASSRLTKFYRLRALAEAVTKYEAPQELHDLLRAAESRIQAQVPRR